MLYIYIFIHFKVYFVLAIAQLRIHSSMTPAYVTWVCQSVPKVQRNEIKTATMTDQDACRAGLCSGPELCNLYGWMDRNTV